MKHHQQKQEEQLVRSFQAVFDAEDRQFILDLTQRIAARQVSSRPLLRVILGDRKKLQLVQPCQRLDDLATFEAAKGGA